VQRRAFKEWQPLMTHNEGIWRAGTRIRQQYVRVEKEAPRVYSGFIEMVDSNVAEISGIRDRLGPWRQYSAKDEPSAPKGATVSAVLLLA